MQHAVAGSFNAASDSTANAVGGSGGSGANSLDSGITPAVEVVDVGSIHTSGRNSSAIEAQSVGGGGGKGAFAIGVSGTLGSDSTSKLQSVGGNGGAAGNAGTVLVTANGTASSKASIATTGDLSYGILAQSVGGGGGVGGFAISGSLSTGGGAAANAVGGNGAGGGAAGSVSVRAGGAITTGTAAFVDGVFQRSISGEGSIGILAQSVGGGGGTGGFSGGLAVGLGGDTATSTLGGVGAVSGTGNRVTVSTESGAAITTYGDHASGILAQSVGGGGGNGGFSIGAGIGLGSNARGSSNAVGGSGSGGGAAGEVDVFSRGAITTWGLLSHGLVAQSIGGGGGNGGFAIGAAFSLSGAAATNAIGGQGSGGGNADIVTVDNAGVIAVHGAESTGILAQSVGGGGGSGGFAGGLAISTGPGASASTVIGGAGTRAGAGAEVRVANSAVIAASGDQSIGILAQSVGGGGGSGGFAIGVSGSLNSDAVSQSTGGSGGSAGIAGPVTVINKAGGVIVTDGAMAHGILAQSAGGGGGRGGFSVAGAVSLGGDATSTVGGGAGGGGGRASTVTVANFDSVYALGVSSIGILAQSVGGGGGVGGFTAGASFSSSGKAINVVGGGAGGGGGLAGDVTVTNHAGALVHTSAANSTGILAQSVGGGGGNGSFSISAAASTSDNGVAQSVGGAGGVASNGGIVRLDNDSAVQTDGDLSKAVFAQSVGGGGGSGGFSVAGAFSTSGAGQTFSVGGTGAGGGQGGAVTVTNGAGGTIRTNGALSDGIVAQSIGGGGGSGGFAVGAGVSLGGDATSTVGGGAGGAAGNASTVVVDNYKTVDALGVSSIGILAQSVGGGGGVGGFTAGASFSSSGKAINVVGGGAGGGGGLAGDVTVTNHAGALVHTSAANSTGILAQSVGGGGGNGSFSISAAASTSDNGVAQSVGGAGSGAGPGGPVTVRNDGLIVTEGALSHALFAQSVGGGGGSGGFSVAGALSTSGGATSSVGGIGAAGGAGGNVVVTNGGDILVRGAGSVGIYAQSVGGGGGSSGFSGALNFTGGGTLTNTVGGGGAGGDGGNVTVISTGSIQTIGADSAAVVAQSIGGGGGNGSFSVSAQKGALTGSALQVGGSGAGTQGATGTVIVQVSGGALQTGGDLSYGLLSQGIGGGGGNGAMSVPDPFTVGALGSVQVIGASGAISGNGNPLSVRNANVIATMGAGSIGFAGQSIGGGGGTSGITGDVAFASAGPLSLALGGSSTGGGSGGAASITNTGVSIQTGGGPAIASGDAAVGLLGQTIGGGGGSGIFALGVVSGAAGPVTLKLGGSEAGVGDGGALIVSSGGQLSTQGRFAPGIVGQTIGGGGGFGAVTAAAGISASGVSLQLGSTGGVGGAADPSNGSGWVVGAGAITTTGALSDALVAQAIGAGGGLAGFVSSGSNSPLAASALGAAGGAGGAGGGVAVTNQSTLRTAGTGAIGLIAQSIGGGGGTAQAFGVSGSALVTLGAKGGAAGAAGSITVISGSPITTSGTGAFGLLAQSVGGGGGFFAAFDTSGALLPTMIAGTPGSGSGGPVSVSLQAPVQTTGPGAHGIIAQSVGGGGGLVGAGAFATALPAAGSFAGSAGGAGAAGPVTLDVAANVLTSGADSTGVVAASTDATGRGGAITVKVPSGVSVIGGVGSGGTLGAGNEPANAVRLIGGSANTLTNNGHLTTLGGIGGFTITGGLGDDLIVNTGRIDGSVDLSSGLNAIDNQASGVFNSGTDVWLGRAAAPSNTLTNQGLLSPGGPGNVLTTNIVGNFLQTPTGNYALDLEFLDQNSDRVNATGTASAAGKVTINILNPGLALPGEHETVIVQADGGITSRSGLALSFMPTAVATYRLNYPNLNDIDLNYVVNFSPGGLTGNQAAVGSTINAIQTVRLSPDFVPIAAKLFYVPTVADLGQTYDSLSGEGTSAIQNATFSSQSLYFQTVIDAAGLSVQPGSGSYALAANSNVAPPRPAGTWRAWAAGFGGGLSLRGGTTWGSAPASSSSSGGAAGFDYRIDPNWAVGFTAGGDNAVFSVPARTTSGSVYGGQFGLYTAGRWDALYATGVLAFGMFNTIERRSVVGVNIGPIESARGTSTARSFGGRAEVGWNYRTGPVVLTPFAALQFNSLWIHGYSETSRVAGNGGLGALGLHYNSQNVTSVPLSLGGQIQSTFVLNETVDLTPSFRAAWVREFNTKRAISAEFLSAPGFPFRVVGAKAARDSAQIQAGLEASFANGIGLRGAALFANFVGNFAEAGNFYGGYGGLKLRW